MKPFNDETKADARKNGLILEGTITRIDPPTGDSENVVWVHYETDDNSTHSVCVDLADEERYPSFSVGMRIRVYCVASGSLVYGIEDITEE